jgi:polar amino acid transport system substrate-binding protein
MLIIRHVLTSLFAAGLFCLSAASFAQDAEPIKAVTDATFPPMEYMENDKFSGFDIELVEAIGQVLHRPIVWTSVDFKGLVPSVVAHRADIAVSAIYITPARAEVIDFTHAYLSGGLVALVKDNNTAINTLADLKGKKISVQVGTKSVQWLHDNIPSAQLVEVEKNQQMFSLVDIGRVDAAVTGKPAAFQYARTKGGVKILNDQLTSEQYGIAVQKDQPQLTTAINGALDQLKANGTYAALVNKWFPTTTK